MKLVECPRCNGTGGYVPAVAPPDPEELAVAQAWLRAEEEFHTGVPAVVNETPIPQPESCPRCGGSRKVYWGAL